MKKTICSLVAATMLGTGCMSTRPYTKSERDWFALAVAGQTADVLSTEYVLDHGFEEGNPVFGKDAGIEKIILGKAAIFGLVYYAGELCPEYRKRFYKMLSFFGAGAAGINTYSVWREEQN